MAIDKNGSMPAAIELRKNLLANVRELLDKK